MDNRDKILEFIKIKGPVLPVQISKEIGSDILMASAHLAELTASKRLKISTIKVGGSPLYYLAGQENMLQKFTESMNDKEKKAYDLLQQNKILRDREQEPVIRVALREIKDFAVPLNVNYNDNKEIFWKWYLTGNDEAELLIKSKLDISEKPKEIVEENPTEKNIVEKQSDASELERTRSQVTEKRVEEQKKTEVPQKQEILKEKETAENQQKQLKQKPKKYKPRETEDSFLNTITKFFEKNKIKVINSEPVKKNSEIDFIVEIPSVVGNLQYYCKAKNKKRINDSDLSNAYVRGQFKKLPILVISPGDLSAKAEEMLAKELNNITFKKI